MNDPRHDPLVSIITPALNSERYIKDNIESVLAQTYGNIEHIVIDGRSTDNTVALVKALDPRAIIVSEPDRGISEAFNKGLALAKGDIIAILNSDDYYANKDVVQAVVQFFSGNPEARVVYGMVRCVEPGTGKTLAIYYNEPFSFEKMLRKLIISHPATFMKKEVYEAVGKFSLDYRICMDHDYLLRVTRRYKPYSMNAILTIMRHGGKSARNQYLGHREAYRIMRSNGAALPGAIVNLTVRYAMTAISFFLQRIGLTRLLLFYRRQKGQL